LKNKKKPTFHSAMQILIQFLKPSDTMYGQNLHGIKKTFSKRAGAMSLAK
jgi:hypothetical protein